jgi:alpha-L-rhamnosidase
MGRQAIDRIRLHWGRVAKSGATTLWESSIYKPRKLFHGGIGSLCHAFGTAPIGVMQRLLLGVKPLEPGFKTFSFAPASCGLENASGSIPTPSGDIRVAWTADESGMNASIEIPPGLSARLPDGGSLTSGKHNLKLR